MSSIAVIAGAIFIIFQLRLNAQLIKATIQENRANVAVALVEKLTNESFARRRKNMHDAVRKYSAIDWKGFDETLEDYEARDFAYTYELIGQLIKEGVLDLKLVRHTLRYTIIDDWKSFEPLAKHLIERFGINGNPWARFEWLAEETEKHVHEEEKFIPKT